MRSEERIAQVSPPPSSPLNNEFFFPIAIGLIDRSTVFVSGSSRPSSRKRRQTLPAFEHVVDRLDQRRLARDPVLHRFQTGLQRLHQRLRLGLPHRAALIGVETADPLLDRINGPNALDDFPGEGRVRRLVDLHEVAARVNEAIRQPDLARHLRIARQRDVGGVAVDLQHAFEARQLRHDLLLAATAREHVGDRRRRRTLPGPIVRRMRPELADLRAAASRIEHRHRRLVAEQPLEAMHGLQLQIIEALGHPRRAPHPARQRLTVHDDAVPRQDLRLTIERRLPSVLGRSNVSDQRRRRHASLDEPRRRRGLDDRTLAASAGVFGTDRAQHPQPRGNPIERFAGLLADPMHLTRAARAERRSRLDHLFAPGQMRRQRADVAPGLAPLRSRRARFRFVVVGRGLQRRRSVPDPTRAVRRR